MSSSSDPGGQPLRAGHLGSIHQLGKKAVGLVRQRPAVDESESGQVERCCSPATPTRHTRNCTIIFG